MAVYRLVQVTQDSRWGELRDTLSRHATKAEAVSWWRERISRHRKTDGGTAHVDHAAHRAELRHRRVGFQPTWLVIEREERQA